MWQLTRRLAYRQRFALNSLTSCIYVTACWLQDVVRDKARGCTFVWVPLTKEVKDVRIYIEKEAGRDGGWGYLIFSFIQSFFFPWTTNAEAGGKGGQFHLPIGGCCGAKFMTVLPTTSQAKEFYRRQGFKVVPWQSKWVFAPAVVEELMATAPANELIRASYCSHALSK